MSRVDQAAFPALAGQGLKIVNVKGDGNCLFRALSDQLYGHQERHENIRAKVVNYMRENPNDFKPFVEVGGSLRHAPKRRCTSKGSTKGPTQDEIDTTWEQYLKDMAKSRTYADQLEVRAFAKAYNIDVLVHGSETIYNVHITAMDTPNAAPRRIIHIAIAAEHYRSVRNINDPDKGPVMTRVKGMDPFKVRTAKHLAGCGSSSVSEKFVGASSGTVSSTSLVTPPPATRPPRDPGLAFLSEESDSEEEKKPVNKPVDKPAKKLTPKSKPIVNRPTLGSITSSSALASNCDSRRALKIAPALSSRLTPLKDEGLGFLDAFRDDSEDEDESWSPGLPTKKALASTPATPSSPTKKRRPIVGPAAGGPAPAPTSLPAKKQKFVDGLTRAPRSITTSATTKRRMRADPPKATPRPTPMPEPDPALAFLDAFADDPDDKDEDWQPSFR
ncbi:hypothetical protein BKA65DRAFT_471567 [Rhexocercosporidium sp. MPI-PUGE-AT-0058]|nr:hypothetical protein BKA65DRAFT_471567 [Rhexocercosporidium sp. MPI-PUGE-AT-0058]